MPDLTERLAHLHDGAANTPASDNQIARDVARGRRALAGRRRRRIAVVGAGTLAAVAIASLAYAGTSSTNPNRVPAPQAGPTQTVTRPSAPSTTDAPPAPTTKLVAYQGKQLRGFEVKTVPAGYVLQGVSDSVLAIARAGDKTPIDEWTGKLVVMLDDHRNTDGVPFRVGRYQGYLRIDDGVLTLAYNDGKHNVAIQAWSNVNITRAQLVEFAKGVTITKDAVEGHG